MDERRECDESCSEQCYYRKLWSHRENERHQVFIEIQQSEHQEQCILDDCDNPTLTLYHVGRRSAFTEMLRYVAQLDFHEPFIMPDLSEVKDD